MDQTKTDNFFYRYIIVAACFSIQAVGIGTYVSYGVFFNPFISEFGWSRASISGASSAAFLLMGLLSIFVGRLNDRIGPRKVMTVTGFFFGVGLLLMSRLNAVWQLYLFYGVVVGIGFSAIDVIPLSTTARWFIKRRGIMTGIVKVGTGAGQLTVPLVASVLIASYGWRTSYLIIGGAGLVLLVSIAQLLRRDPSQMRLSQADGRETARDNAGLAGGGLSFREALHTRQFWTICGVNLVIGFCTLSIIVHIVPHAQDTGVPAIRAAGVLSAVGGVSMAGRFITGIAIDRIGSKKVMVVCFILLIVGLLWLQVANELWMLYVFAVVYGISHGGFFTAISPIVAEFFGISAHGVLFGIVIFSGTVGGAVGPVVAGYIFDVTDGYSLAFWLSMLVSILGLVLIVFLKPIKEREKEGFFNLSWG
jgi:MFS family permease